MGFLAQRAGGPRGAGCGDGMEMADRRRFTGPSGRYLDGKKPKTVEVAIGPVRMSSAASLLSFLLGSGSYP